METNPVPTPPTQVPELGFDAKQRFITTLIETLFINVKSSDTAPDKYEMDPRASTSEIDEMLIFLNSERKRAAKREQNHRAELKKEALNRNGISNFINFGA